MDIRDLEAKRKEKLVISFETHTFYTFRIRYPSGKETNIHTHARSQKEAVEKILQHYRDHHEVFVNAFRDELEHYRDCYSLPFPDMFTVPEVLHRIKMGEAYIY